MSRPVRTGWIELRNFRWYPVEVFRTDLHSPGHFCSLTLPRPSPDPSRPYAGGGTLGAGHCILSKHIHPLPAEYRMVISSSQCISNPLLITNPVPAVLRLAVYRISSDTEGFVFLGDQWYIIAPVPYLADMVGATVCGPVYRASIPWFSYKTGAMSIVLSITRG